MRVFTTELRKLFSNKIFFLIFSAVFIMNGYLIFRTANSAEAMPSDYHAIYTELEGLSDEEKLEFFDEHINNSASGLYNYNWKLFYDLANECYDVVYYKTYLENIETQAESMSSISIFSDPDTFNYRSIVKTPPAYENVQEVVPVFDVSQGIILATDNSFTDILIGFIALFSVLSVMLSDRENGMSRFLFSLKRGRGYLLLTKSGVLALVLFACVFLIYIENLLISGYIYGLGDLSRPIQSVSGFIGCNLNISVLEYLVLYVIFKFFAMLVIGLILTFTAINTKNFFSFFGISATLVITEAVAYAKIHPLSIYSIFRYINIISFTKVNEIFCNYKNINFWEYPIPLIEASVLAILITAVLALGFSVFLYSKKRNLEFRKLDFRFKAEKKSKIHSHIFYEFYKSLALQKGFAIIIVFIAASGFLGQSFVKKYDIADVYYKYYTTEHEGDVTQNTLDFCDAEEQRFAEISDRITVLSETTNGFSKEMNDLQNEYALSLGFYPFQERVNQIKDVTNARIFYDTGYKRAFGIDGYDDDMKYALFAMLLCSLLISPLIANDNRYKMQFVINATASGRKSYIKCNIFIAIVYGLIASLLWIISYARSISTYYGHGGLSAPLQSIVDFTEFPLDITVLGYIILIAFLRTVFIIGISLIMLRISSCCRNVLSALLINSAVFVLPLLIYLLGADFMVHIGFNPLLSVNVLFNEASVSDWLIPLFMVLGLGCIFYRKQLE